MGQRSVWGDGVYTGEVNRELILVGSVVRPTSRLTSAAYRSSWHKYHVIAINVTGENVTHNVTCTHVTRPRSASADPRPNPNISSELVLLRLEYLQSCGWGVSCTCDQHGDG